MEKPSSVVSFLITFLLATAVYIQGQEPVRDIAGNPVLIGEQYFIQPTNNNGGGLVPAAINILPFCPLGITQASLCTQPGLPVTFQYQDVTPFRFLSTKDAVSITFVSNIWPLCNDLSKIWEVDISTPAAKEPPILIGGNLTSRNVGFVIQPAERGALANIYRIRVVLNPPTV